MKPSQCAGAYLLLCAALVLPVGCRKAAAPNPERAAESGTRPSATSPASPAGSAPVGSLADRLKAVTADDDGAKKMPLFDWRPVGPGTSKMVIPVVEGLALTEVITSKYGDLQNITTVQNITEKTIKASFSGEDFLRPDANGKYKTFHGKGDRVFDTTDLATSHNFMLKWRTGAIDSAAGWTTWSTSTDVLQHLRQGETVPFAFSFDQQMLMSDLMAGHPTLSLAFGDQNGRTVLHCSMTRASETDVAFPVLVNNVRAELPAMHARCDLTPEEQIHFWILDQLSNPVLLADVFDANSDHSQKTMINFPAGPDQPGAAAAMEAALAAKKPVELQSIYFDFASAVIRPESDPVLQQIATTLQRNPGWRLSVSGHTDNIGNDRANLDLSRQRAAAVRDALVSRYKIAADRVTTDGFGASRPIETNATVEGRSINRRVELQRL